MQYPVNRNVFTSVIIILDGFKLNAQNTVNKQPYLPAILGGEAICQQLEAT